MSRSPLASLILILILLITSCRSVGQLPDVVDVRDISSSSGKPEISSIIDLGAVPVPHQGKLGATHRDGSAAIGEILLLEGSGFGKQPTVTIGGRPAAVLARVEGGGIVVRVPWGIDPGEVEVEVSNAGGRHARTFPIRRVGLVATGRSLWPLRIAADGTVQASQPIPLPGAEHLAISSEGAAAYVAGGMRLRIVDLTAAVPAVQAEHTLRGSKVVDLCTAEQASLGLVVTDTHLQVFETSDPLRPALYNPVALPAEVVQKRPLAAALGGQGRLLALLLAEGNQVAVLDLRDPVRPGTPVFFEVLPGNPLSLVEDLRVSADEGSVWVASGDGPLSIASGIQPLRISLIQVRRGEPGALQLSLHRTWELGERLAPRQLAVARGEPIPPGTVIRAEPSTSAVYVATIASELLKSAAAAPAGAVLRSAPGQPADRLLAGNHPITSLDVVGKTQIVLGLGVDKSGQGHKRVVISRRAWEQDSPHMIVLDEAGSPSAPPWLGEVRAQP